jgi:regulator of sirC expression with transglutaminase-like and TPR domain
MGTVFEALACARAGDVDGALAILREEEQAGRVDDALVALLFALLSARERQQEALEVAHMGFARAQEPLARSTWALRRGLLYAELGERSGALADLQLVLKLKASEPHLEQARRALLKVAALKK